MSSFHVARSRPFWSFILFIICVSRSFRSAAPQLVICMSLSRLQNGTISLFFFFFFSSRCFFLRSNSLCDKLCADAAWCKRLVPCICFRKGGSSFTVWLKKGLLNRQTNQTGSCQATAERQREGGEGRWGGGGISLLITESVTVCGHPHLPLFVLFIFMHPPPLLAIHKPLNGTMLQVFMLGKSLHWVNPKYVCLHLHTAAGVNSRRNLPRGRVFFLLFLSLFVSLTET